MKTAVLKTLRFVTNNAFVLQYNSLVCCHLVLSFMSFLTVIAFLFHSDIYSLFQSPTLKRLRSQVRTLEKKVNSVLRSLLMNIELIDKKIVVYCSVLQPSALWPNLNE